MLTYYEGILTSVVAQKKINKTRTPETPVISS